SCSLRPPAALASVLFFSTRPAPAEIYPLSLHDALPISEVLASRRPGRRVAWRRCRWHPAPVAPPRLAGRHPWERQAKPARGGPRSGEHTSELQSLTNLVCPPLLEKKKHSAPRQRAASPT